MTEITRAKFNGLQAIELRTAALRLVAISQFGPRIAHLSTPRGQNLLLWIPGKYTRGKWDLRGGHRAWVTRPGADENEDTYVPDNDRCDVELLENGFRLTGAESPINRTRRGFTVRAVDADRLEIDNFVVNNSDMLYSGGMWALTCTVPGKGTKYGVTVGNGTEWDTFSMVMFRRWGGHGVGGFPDKQIQVGKDMLVVTPRGIENKRMLQSHHGIIAMSDPSREVTFAKKVPSTGGPYPLNSNIAIYIGPKNFMVEMETMGAETTLRPSEQLIHRETWVLKPGAVPLTSAKRLTDLFIEP